MGERAVARKPALVFKQITENSFGLAPAMAALMSLALTGCALISSNVKYLFAPEVRTCAPTRVSPAPDSPDGDVEYSAESWWRCSARVNKPIPKCLRTTSGDGSGTQCTPKGADQITTVTVAQSTEYANLIEEEYIGAKGEYGSISSAFGLVLIPVGASAMALGGLGESATAVSSLGFGSAAILGTGYWLSNQPREKAYMAGAKALECLKTTMQPFDVEQGALTLGQLGGLDSNLNKSKEELQTRITKFAGELTLYQTRGGTPDNATRKKLCYGEKLLKAANASLQAATSSYDSGTKYYNYSYDNAGYEMEYSVDAINNEVSSSMIATEPDLSSLASKLSTIIPDSAQKLAGIDKDVTASKTAVEKAATALKQALAVAPKPPKVVTPSPYDVEAQKLVDKVDVTNNAAEEVVDRTPPDIVPKAKACLKVFNQPGAPPDVLTLGPAGDIALSPGNTAKVTISGGKLPYAVRWLCNCYNVGVTAQTTYEDTKATIVIAASDTARVDSYPLMITDATGVGSSLNVVVASKKVDNSDTPDCVEASVTSPPTGGKPSNPATVNAVAQAAARAHDAALQAATAANAAKTDADKAEAAASDGNKPDAAAAAQRATRDAASAYSALARAQMNAREARARAGASNDLVLTSLVQTADSEVGSAANSAAAAGVDAARAQRAAP